MLFGERNKDFSPLLFPFGYQKLFLFLSTSDRNDQHEAISTCAFESRSEKKNCALISFNRKWLNFPLNYANPYH